jgi:hypothetical protein
MPGSLRGMRPANPCRIGFVFAGLLAIAGCGSDQAESADEAPQEAPRLAEAKKVPVGKNVWLEIQGERRRVVVQSKVCLREGQLELLLCKKHTKEHEAIVTADADARDIHKALLVTGAVPGSPVRYQPKFQAPTGTRIRVSVQFEDKGKSVTVPAQSWVRDFSTKKELQHAWVFAGSVLWPTGERDDKSPPSYGANSGDVICLSNFEDAMLDLPVNSPKDNAELVFEAYTERIPPLDTPVKVILEPLPEPKKPEK